MRRRVLISRGGTLFLSLAILAGCGGGGGGGDGGVTNPPPPAPVATVTVTLTPSQINVGQTSQANAVLRDAQGSVLSGRTITWSMSNSAVASVAGDGLVTGLAAGTATITAASEGRTGSATLTVNAPATPPKISGITVTQNGQAANLAQVAGPLTISFSLELPTGYTGTLIARVDTAEFHRETVTAPALSTRNADGAVALGATIVTKQVIIETARTQIQLSADEIREIPSVRNGARIATLTVTPGVAGGQSTTEQVNFTANNPIHAHGAFSYNGATAIGLDGKPYASGDGTGSVFFGVYGTEVVNGFEVILTDRKALYGHDPVGGVLNVYQRITRTDLKNFPLLKAPVEKSDLTYILDKVTVNGIDIDPQVDYFGNSQHTTDLIGSGFANTQQQVQGLTPPAGRSLQLVTQPSVDLMSGAIHGRFTLEPLNLDNLGPRQSSLANEPVFSFLDRLTTVGGAARWSQYGYGANNGQLSAHYEFGGGFRPDRLTDLSGVDAAKTEYYAGPISDQSNLFKLQYKVGATFSLGESSGSRSYTAGVRAFDKLGNFSDFTLRTTSKNPWNISGSSSSGTGLGVDVGAFGFTQTRASLNLTAMPTESIWNQSSIDPSLCWFWTVSNSLVGIPNGFLSARAKLNGTWGFGAGTALDRYKILNSSGGATSGSATIFTNSFLADVFAGAGGMSNQGLYEFDFKAADNAGLYIGDNLYPRSYRFLLDYEAPKNVTLTYNGTVTPGAASSATVTGTDNYALRALHVGVRFNYPSSLFSGGQVYLPFGVLPIAGTLGGMVTKDASIPVMGVVPSGFRFFDPFSGIIDMGSFHRSNGGMVQFRDMAWNLSPITFASFPNTAPIPTITNISSVKASISSTNWCPGTCSGGGQSTVNLNFNYLDSRATGAPMFSKAEWFAIPQSGNGIVYPLGKVDTFTEAPEGSGRRITYSLPLDLRGYCAPYGPTLVIAVGYSADGQYLVKNNPFFSTTVQTPARYTNFCNLPY